MDPTRRPGSFPAGQFYTYANPPTMVPPPNGPACYHGPTNFGGFVGGTYNTGSLQYHDMYDGIARNILTDPGNARTKEMQVDPRGMQKIY